MDSYKSPYTIKSKILKFTSKISELISDIEYMEKHYSSVIEAKEKRFTAEI